MLVSEEKYAERLAKLIRWSNMSANAFSKHIGLRNAENLYQILRGNHGISVKLADTIVASYPQISHNWLRHGEGEMFVEDKQVVKFYNYDAEHNIANVDRLQLSSEIILPIEEKGSFAMIYNGCAMGNTMPPGTIVVLRRIDTESIIPGKEYLIVAGNVTMLRVVRAPMMHNSYKPMWRLVAADRNRFDDVEVMRNEIEATYKVVAKLIINY
ncbi:MAG: hypothetical protein R3Y68_00595 [Rikenellaceae bacterium]